MSQVKWKYNEIELNADFEDVDFLESYSKAMYELSDNCKDMPKDGRDMDRIKELCTCYHRFFDSVFGKGTSQKLFKNKRNLRLYEEAFISLVNMNKKANEEMTLRRMSLQPKNRAQRRKLSTIND
ncbi:MAG: DUF6673 family protein [Thomasclavelia sp.]|uniref:DUF6673 family protein n=1 Tax=Thomasclavelia sp. TaxID=3025757 RepID=UPI0039A107B2